jgi:hypothetical protein
LYERLSTMKIFDHFLNINLTNDQQEWANAFVFWDIGTQPNFNFYDSEQDRSGKSKEADYVL